MAEIPKAGELSQQLGEKAPEEDRTKEAVLLFDEDRELLEAAGKILAQQLPFADIVCVAGLDEFRECLQQREFEVVVLEHLLSEISGIELIVELKLRDREPGVLVLSKTSDPQVLATVYNAGCQRCIVKEGRWLDELAPAVRHLLRIKRLEEQNASLIAKLTEANVQLCDKNKRLDEFSGTVAHDIRGPLGGINMKLEYMCDMYAEEVDPRLKKLLSSTLDSSRRLLGVVQAMYEFAKIGARAESLEEVRLPQLIEEVVQDLHFDESLDIQIGIGDLPAVWGNPHLLRKVFINLINNAVKYSDKQQIVINITPTRTFEKSIGRFCEFAVEDNGPGIPEEDLGEIFTMFRRGKDAGKKCDGVGIGLSVVKQIVEVHYGQIRAFSEPGGGARFVISLPLERIELNEHALTAANAAAGSAPYNIRMLWK